MKRSELSVLRFFNRGRGEPDEVAWFLSCFDSCAYNILRNKYPDSREAIISLFLSDINPTLWYHPVTGVFRIYNQSRNLVPLWRNYTRIEQLVRQEDPLAIPFLEDLLDREGIVMIQTAFEKIRYFTWYDPNSDIRKFDNSDYLHVCLAVGHEEDRLYYAEKMPFNLNMSRFVPCVENEEIGQADKTELEYALNFFLRCFVVHLDEGRLSDRDGHQRDVLHMLRGMVENFYAKDLENNGYIRCHGLSALEKLKEFFLGGVDLKNYYLLQYWQLINNLEFDLMLIRGTRSILGEYVKLQSVKVQDVENHRLLLDTLKDAFDQWEMVERVIIKGLRSGETRLNLKCAEQVEKLIQTESQLHVLLEKFVKDLEFTDRGRDALWISGTESSTALRQC